MARWRVRMSAGLQLQNRLTADEQHTLKVLCARWGAMFSVRYDGQRWHASRKDGTGDTLHGLTPG